MSEPYVRELRIVDNFVDRDLRIDLTPAEGRPFRHLILTGRNGCGKSATLQGFRRPGDGSPPQVASTAGPPLQIFAAHRGVRFEEPKGPTRERNVLEPARIEQMLINWRSLGALAAEDGDDEVAGRMRGQIEAFEAGLNRLLAPTVAKLVFWREHLMYRLELDGVKSRFNQLPDGPKAVLELWLGIWHAVAARGAQGYVLIDEPETHLHTGLQERILPFLASAFPEVQLIIATHSAAVAASLDDALVYDLTKKRGWKSEDLHGWRYGRVLTEVFGLDDEYSDAVSAELRQLEALRDLADPSPAEVAELERLAARLSQSSHAMALEVWTRLQLEREARR